MPSAQERVRDDEAPKAEAGKGLAACLWQRLEGARELAVGSELRVLVRAVKERHVVTSRRLRTQPRHSSARGMSKGLGFGWGVACSGEMLNSSKVRCTCVSGSGHEITQSHLRTRKQPVRRSDRLHSSSKPRSRSREKAGNKAWLVMRACAHELRELALLSHRVE